MNNFVVSFRVCPSAPEIPLGFEARINDQVFFDCNHVDQDLTISHPVDNTQQLYSLKLILKNKQPEHTTVDSQGNIVTDAVLTVRNLAIDGVELGHIVTELANYQHNFNGTGPSTDQQFFGVMGCNGQVSMEFSTPIYIWLLEHM